MGIPADLQNLIFLGKFLQDDHKMKDYGIKHDSTVILNMRLLGGCPDSSSKGVLSFKDAIKGRRGSEKPPDILPNLPKPYIVEQMNQVLALTINPP